MPWKTVSLLKVRKRFIEAILARRHIIQNVCDRFGISRKTGYKWFNRFRRRGVMGLRDQSRRPRRSPTDWPSVGFSLSCKYAACVRIGAPKKFVNGCGGSIHAECCLVRARFNGGCDALDEYARGPSALAGDRRCGIRA